MEHCNAIAAWLACSQGKNHIDREMVQLHLTQTAYWEDILRHIVTVIKLLAECGLAVRGTEEVIGFPQNGNYLDILEAIIKFDQFVREHIKHCENKERSPILLVENKL